MVENRQFFFTTLGSIDDLLSKEDFKPFVCIPLNCVLK